MLNRYFHILLASLLFFSSTGVVFSKHYCQGSLRTISFFTKARSCYQQVASSCPMHAAKQHAKSEHKGNCCDNQVEYLKSDTDQEGPSVESMPQLLLIDLPPTPLSSMHLQNFAWTQQHAFLCYQPPPRWLDHTVALQVFLC